MKKINYFATLIMAAIVLSSCAGLNKMKENSLLIEYKAIPEVLESHADEIGVTITGKFPIKFFNKNAIVQVIPVLKYEDGETLFDSITLQGENVEANNKIIKFETGGDFSYTDTIPYIDAMKISDLEIRMKASIKETSVDFDPVKIAEGVIITPKLVINNPRSLMMEDKFVRIISDSYEADIHYVINRAEVRNSELRNEDIVNLEAYVKEASEKENLKYTGVKISAYASPDGEYDFNEKLAEKRKETAEKYLARRLKRAEVEEAEVEGFYSLKSTAEDWDGFKKLMQESDIEDKDLILRVLSMYSDPVVREREIKNIAETFEILKVDILPKLRRSVLGINIDKVGFSDEEILEYVDSNPDTLDLEEVLYAGKLAGEDLDKKLAIYQLAVEKAPNCYRAHNNTGWVNVLLGNLSAAKEAFEKAQSIKDMDIITNNMGVVALLENDIKTAEEYFTSAMGAGETVNYNLGIIKVMEAEYNTAVNYFGNTRYFNTALAKLLAGETADALSILNSMEEKGAKTYYLIAVIGARTNDTGLLFNNLRIAIGKDASLKEYAKTDMEFGKYFEDDTFKSIVE